MQAQAAAKGFTIEVDAAGKAILKATSDGGKAFADLGQHVRAATEDMKAQGQALDAINAKYGQSAKDKANKYGRPGDDAAAQADERTKRLSGQNAVDNTLMFKLRDKGANLTAADIPELEAVLAAERKNDKMINNRLGGRAGLYSLEGLRDDSNWRQIKAQWQSFIDSEKNKVPVDGAQPKAAQTSGSGNTAPQQSRTVYVDLRTDKGTETVQTNESGAAALLRILKNARSTSSR